MIRSSGRSGSPSQSELDWVRNHRESLGRFIVEKEKETVRGKLEEETDALKQEKAIRESIPELLESLERKEENWNCVVCGKEFETQETLENHGILGGEIDLVVREEAQDIRVFEIWRQSFAYIIFAELAPAGIEHETDPVFGLSSRIGKIVL